MPSHALKVRSALNGATGEAERVVRQNGGFLCVLGRAGYAARAVLYFTIGTLAGLSALGEGGKLADNKTALDELHRQPLGAILLAAMAAGLFGYGAWRLVQSLLDPAREAHPRWGAVQRAGWFVAALLHFALAVHALARLRLVRADSSAADVRESAGSAMTLGLPGTILVAAAGAVLLGLCVHEVRCAIRGKLDERLNLSRVPSRLRHPLVLAGRAGIGARGLVFGVIGAYLVGAGITADPSVAKGFAEALAAIRSAPFGGVLLGGVAIGLLAFALYQLVEARYRRILD